MKQGTLHCEVIKTPKNYPASEVLSKEEVCYINMFDFLKGNFSTHIVLQDSGELKEVILNRDEFKIIKVVEVITNTIEDQDEIRKFIATAEREKDD